MRRIVHTSADPEYHRWMREVCVWELRGGGPNTGINYGNDVMLEQGQRVRARREQLLNTAAFDRGWLVEIENAELKTVDVDLVGTVRIRLTTKTRGPGDRIEYDCPSALAGALAELGAVVILDEKGNPEATPVKKH